MWKKANIHKRYVRNFTLYSHLVGKRAKRIISRRMWMVFGFGLNHTSESSVRAKYTIYLPSFLAAIHYYVAFPLADNHFITKDPLLVPQESRNVDVHPEGSVMDIHRVFTKLIFITTSISWHFLGFTRNKCYTEVKRTPALNICISPVK